MPKQRPEEALKKLGQRIRARRYFLQLPLDHFARATSLSTSMLNAYESGVNHPPALTLKRIAKALNTSTTDLLSERTKTNTEDIDFFMGLFAEPSIYKVAISMHNMTPAARRSFAATLPAP